MSNAFPPPPPPPGTPYSGYSQPPAAPKPSNNLALAIVSTVLCCWPLGIVSIVYAAKVDGHWSAGRYREAVDASRKARNWAIASIVTVVVLIVGFFLLAGIGAWSDANF